MSNTRRSKVMRVLGELAIITVSIILAFSLDAWWTSQQKEKTRRDSLETIKEELYLAIDEIARARSVHETTRDKLTAWVGFTDPQFEGTLTDAQVSTLVPLRQTMSDIPNSVISRFLNGADIGSLSDQRLVRLLSTWPSLVQDYNLTEMSNRNVMLDLKDTFQNLSPGVADLYAAISDQYQSKFTPQWEEVMSSFHIENSAYRALNVTTIVISENLALEASARELIGAIDRYVE